MTLDQGDHEGAFTTGMIAFGYRGSVFKKRDVLAEHGMAIFYKDSRAEAYAAAEALDGKKDQFGPAVSHSIITASVYESKTVVDFIFCIGIIGSSRLEVVSRLELPERLARLKMELSARQKALWVAPPRWL
ncbi:hypothetical protein EC968_010314 [Mortierella alpina]|nr:hypothetical protein EC968_010314 [Mortierella alpina]